MPTSIGSAATPTARATAREFLPAAFLIFFGLVLQLGAFGYGLASSGHLWLISVIAGNTWNAIVSHVIVPAFGGRTEFWPLLLVGAGVAFLLDQVRVSRPRVGGAAPSSTASVSGFSGANRA